MASGWRLPFKRQEVSNEQGFKVKIETEEEFVADLSARNDEFDSLIAEARRQGEEVGLKHSDITAAIAKVRADKIAFPEWHREVLTDREADLREGKESFTDWDTAKDQLK